MSRYYHAYFNVIPNIAYHDDKASFWWVERIIDGVWNCNEQTLTNESNNWVASGRDYLYGGESEEEFARRVWNLLKTVPAVQHVMIEMTYLEDLPFEDYHFDRDDKEDNNDN